MALRLSVEVRSTRLPEMRGKLVREAGARIQRATNQLAQRVQAEAPVATGFLRSSVVGRTLGPTEGEVHVQAPYAAFVNYGTRKQAANPFADRAAAQVADEMPGMFLGLLD